MDKIPCFTRLNAERISKYLFSNDTIDSRDRNNWQVLGEKVRKGKIVDSRKIRPDVVTMNSRVQLKDLDTNKEILINLVFPDDASIEQGKLSVLSPMGTAILGYSQGDAIKWEDPYRIRRIRLIKIHYQPEAAGDYTF
ncbi:MAG TPA: transcription elongation factor GreAB [Elusimicrobia bacterium]|nr:transcription elongation factor GreAB [Elusimicrobiota bacterium]